MPRRKEDSPLHHFHRTTFENELKNIKKEGKKERKEKFKCSDQYTLIWLLFFTWIDFVAAREGKRFKELEIPNEEKKIRRRNKHKTTQRIIVAKIKNEWNEEREREWRQFVNIRLALLNSYSFFLCMSFLNSKKK